VKLSAVRTNEGRLFQTVGRSMRTDEQQCLSMKTVLYTIGVNHDSRNLITRKLTRQSIAVSIFTLQTLREQAVATGIMRIAGTRQVAGSGAVI